MKLIRRVNLLINNIAKKNDTPQKLEFGCGSKKPKEGFCGVDIREFSSVKYVCNAWEIDKYIAANTITEIYSRHFFEHLTFAQANLTLKAWNKILVVGGIVQIIVPDIEYHIKQFLNPNPSEPSETNTNWTVLQHAIAGFWGWQRDGETKMWDVHKSGYDFRLLKMKLSEYGFCEIERLEDKPWNLNIRSKKP